ncbi:MAG: hypothetical protein ABI556_05505 [Gemmatimonadales bacterium]
MLPYLVEIEGYRARVERDREGVLHGRVIEIHEVITFKATTQRMVETKFARALQAYFTRCEQSGTKPEKPQGLGF